MCDKREGYLDRDTFRELENISRDLSKRLRHDVETKFDEEGAVSIRVAVGWFNGCVDVRTILRAMQPRGRDKARFEAYYSTVRSAGRGNETTDVVQRIRASQGHSVNITAKMLGRGRVNPAEMPRTIAHGTKARLASSIVDKGLLPGGNKGGRNEVYFAELDPMQVTPNDGLPGFRHGSDAIVLVNGPKAAEQYVFTRSSTGPTSRRAQFIRPLFRRSSTSTPERPCIGTTGGRWTTNYPWRYGTPKLRKSLRAGRKLRRRPTLTRAKRE